MTQLDIRPISAEATHPLRQAILRPRRPSSELIFPRDDAPDTHHFGAYWAGELVGIASLYREPPSGEADPAAWRLRGMATSAAFQRRGFGRTLLEACLAYVEAQGGTLLWCNARTVAVSFYQDAGFQTRGEEFDIPGVGPHYVMWRSIPQAVELSIFTAEAKKWKQ